MLEVIGAAPGSHTDIDWHEAWKNSQQFKDVRAHLTELKEKRPQETEPAASSDDKLSYREFAAGLWTQFIHVTKRIFQQLWRTPSYIYSKVALCVASSLFIGFR